jgi:hypothetical protein
VIARAFADAKGQSAAMAPRICQNNTRQTSTGHLNRHRLAMVTILAPIFTSRSLYRHCNADVSGQ